MNLKIQCPYFPYLSHENKIPQNTTKLSINKALASHAGVFRGAPLKMPAWEANKAPDTGFSSWQFALINCVVYHCLPL